MAEGMTPLSGLALRRRVCELIDEKVGHCRQCGQDYRTFSCGPSHAIMFNAQAPMYEADASLSEALLDKVCREQGWRYVHTFDGRSHIYCIYPLKGSVCISDSDSKDPNEARARAIVEALSR